jgi:hypothetical protein
MHRGFRGRARGGAAPKGSRFSRFAAALALLLLSAPEVRAAACNIISRGVEPFPSTQGRVDRPIAGPDDVVSVFADLGCNPGALGFARDAADNTVTLNFQPPSGANTSVEVPTASIETLECGRMDALIEPSSCNVLQFRMPDTSAMDDTGGNPIGLQLTGPVQIVVERAGVGTIAIIDDLYRPTSSCSDRVADAVFSKMVVLPSPNVIPAGDPKSLPAVLGAVDGNGNLLVPWDYSNALLAPPGDPVATVLTYDSAANACVPDTRFLASFNTFGKAIPPIQRKVPDTLASTKIVSTIDVLHSVTRILGADPDTGASIFPCLGVNSFGALMIAGRGAVNVLRPVAITVETASPLVALRTSPDTVILGADELIVGKDLNADGDAMPNDLIARILDVASGNEQDTQMALGLIHQSPGRPFVAAQEQTSAFLQSEEKSGFGLLNGDDDFVDLVPRIFDPSGSLGPLAPAQWTSADPRPGVDQRPGALSGPIFYFRTAEWDEAGRATARLTNDVGDSGHPSLDGVGQHVAYDSTAPGFGGFAQTHRDVFVFDGASAQTRLASEALPGTGGNGDSSRPSLSASEGDQVAWQSEATDLAPLLVDHRIWERGSGVGGGFAFDDLGGTMSFAMDFEVGAADVAGVDLSGHGPGQAELTLVGERPKGTSGAWSGTIEVPDGTSPAVTIQAMGSYLICPGGNLAEKCPPLPLFNSAWGPGSTITLMGTVAVDPSLPAELSNARVEIVATITSVDGGHPGNVQASFSHTATFEANLSPGQPQIYARGLGIGGSIHAVSVNDAGKAANGASFDSSISADGRFVAFASDASNLVTGDNNSQRDVFVHDRDADGNGVFDEPGGIRTVRVSVTGAGAQAQGGSSDEPSISADGRFVAFRSAASNLTPNAFAQIFVHDRDVSGDGTFDEPGDVATQLVSLNDKGVVGGAAAGVPSISADGHFVAFHSDAANLVPDDSGAWRDVFVRDRAKGRTERASVDPAGFEPVGGGSENPAISADGRFVVYESDATTLVDDDTNGKRDVFRFDRLTGSVERISEGSQSDAASVAPAVSGNGLSVGFRSAATTLVTPDAGLPDVFLRGLGAGPSLNGDDDQLDSVLQAFDTDTRSLLPGARTAADAVFTGGGRALVLTPEAGEGATNLNSNAQTLLFPLRGDTDATDTVAQIFDPIVGLVDLGVAVTAGALDEVACLAVSEAQENGTDLDGNGTATGSVLVTGLAAGLVTSSELLRNVGVPVTEVGAAGTRCFFTVPEAGSATSSGLAGLCGPAPNGGCDLNGDGDGLDQVLFFYDHATEQLVNVGLAARGFQVGPGGALVAFPVPEAAQGMQDLNGDGDALDDVQHVLDVELAAAAPASAGLAPATTAVVNTRRCMVDCTDPGCETFRLGAIGPNRTVSFKSSELCQAIGDFCLPTAGPGLCDLDANGRGTDSVIWLLSLNGLDISSAIALTISDEVEPVVDILGGTFLRNFVIGQQLTECDAARVECPETRTKVPVGGFIPVATACEERMDVQGDGKLDCTKALFYFAGDTQDGGDGVIDLIDNDPTQKNPDQTDTDGDGLPDSIDPDPFSTPPDCNLNGDTYFDAGTGMQEPLIDQDDIDLILEAVGQAAQPGGGDARDRDGDGKITVGDARKCVLQCTFTNCGPPPSGSCGLGAELALVLTGLQAVRRRRRGRANGEITRG